MHRLIWLGISILILGTGLAMAQNSGTPCPTQDEARKICEKTGCPAESYKPLECWPSTSGPSEANILETTENFLYCSGPYALCFYSGPPGAIDAGSGSNPPVLPCVEDQSGDYADCRCQVFTGEYYVDVFAIRNRNVYLATIALCGTDGSECVNMQCMKKGDCGNLPSAPVCDNVNAQAGGSAQPFYPAPANRVSTYSTAMQEPYGFPDPTAPGNTVACAYDLYAGCMTAACELEPDDPAFPGAKFAQCKCPIYDGCYQIPKVNNYGCDLGKNAEGRLYVWSSSNNVTTVDQTKPSCGSGS